MTNRKKIFLFIQTTFFYLLVSGFLISPLFGLKNISIDQSKPVLYYADSQTYDRELGILILKGHVEFNYEGTTLKADYVTYNEQADLITASGHVHMREAEGDVYWGEYVELTGDMKEGILLGLRALLD
ncbi:MAG: LptA/OstA family protein, partial [Chlamydiota bacterium]